MPYFAISSRLRLPAKRRMPPQTRQRWISIFVCLFIAIKTPGVRTTEDGTLSLMLLLLGDIYARAGAGPIELQGRSSSTGLVQRNRKLFGRGGVLRDLHVNPGEVLALVVLRTPLSRLFVDDQLPAVLVGDRVEGIAACRNVCAADREVNIGLKAGGGVGAGTPNLSVRDEPAKDLTAAHGGAAVIDGYGLAVGEGNGSCSGRACGRLLCVSTHDSGEDCDH